MTRIALLAEDQTDCDALEVLIRRLVAGRTVGINHFASTGCAVLKRKAPANLRLALQKGCSAAVIVHDLDRDPANHQLKNEAALRQELEGIECPSGLKRLVCIPVEELEAWFWADPAVIAKVGGSKGKPHQNPHLLARPKEALIALSRDAGGKPRYSTNDNPKLAALLDTDLCGKRCQSFADFRAFIVEAVEA